VAIECSVTSVVECLTSCAFAGFCSGWRPQAMQLDLVLVVPSVMP
jgi:hypothetical protein